MDVVFEMSGGAVFDASLAALAPFGRLVTYGIASREANTVRSGDLMRRSRAVVGFWLMHCIGRPTMIDEALADLFDRVRRDELRVVTGPAYPLAHLGYWCTAVSISYLLALVERHAEPRTRSGGR